MIVTRYYTSNEDLNKSEEPYRSVVGLLDQLYTDVPEGCAVLTYRLFLFITLCLLFVPFTKI